MDESENILSPDSSTNESKDIKDEKFIILLTIKYISFGILLLVFLFQIESLLYLILSNITNDNTFLIYILVIFLHIALLKYIIQSFLFILHCPILKQICFYNIACRQLNELLDAANDFSKLFILLKNQIKPFNNNNKLFISEISKTINIYKIFFEQIKSNIELSKEQNILCENLCSWMKNYEEYKNNCYLNNKEQDKKNENQNYIYYLRKINHNSKKIIKILNNFICTNYDLLSIKKLYSCFINNSFSSLNQYSLLFNQKFNNIYHSFITSDNKLIDYTIVSYDKLNEIYKNNDYIKKGENMSKNLVLFCNPNGMIYQLFTPEKFLFLLRGGCDVLLWNYRGYGFSTGHPTFKNAKTDIIELFDYIQKKYQYKEYGAYGYSVGGGSATFLSQNRKLDVLICDRNYSSITEIAKTIPIFGGILYYFSKLLNFKYDNNISEYIKSKNKNICKIVLCDPYDDIIPNCSNIKSGISKYIIKSYCIEKNIKTTENILDLFLNIENNKEQRDKFIESLLYIMDILIEINENPLQNLLAKNNNNKEDNFDNSLLININDNNELNKKNFNKKLINTIISFFKCFNYSSEDLESFKYFSEKRLKILHIDNYFNNFFIWGTVSYNHINALNGFLNPFKIQNNIYHLNNALNILNKFLNDKFIKSIAEEDSYKMKYNNLLTIRSCLFILKNKNEFINSMKSINLGSLIRLDCGHNGLYSENDEKNLIDILEYKNFIKYS